MPSMSPPAGITSSSGGFAQKRHNCDFALVPCGRPLQPVAPIKTGRRHQTYVTQRPKNSKQQLSPATLIIPTQLVVNKGIMRVTFFKQPLPRRIEMQYLRPPKLKRGERLHKFDKDRLDKMYYYVL